MRRTPLFAFAVFLWAGALCTALFYLVLQQRGVLILRLDLESDLARTETGEIWWTAGIRSFHPGDSVGFRVAPGRNTVLVEIPVEVDSLQIRPSDAAGMNAAVRTIALETGVATLHTWDATHGFGGWHAAEGLDGFRRDPDALRFHVAAASGGFQVDDIRPLRSDERRRVHLLAALAGGFLAGLLHAAAVFVLRRGPGAAKEGPAAAAASARSPRGAWLLLGGTTALCAVLAWLAGRAILKRHADPVFTDSGEYSLVFVDHLGHRLSEKDGSLRLALDPYSLYRNAPGQETRRFRIDRHGFRGGFDETDPRPRVLCVGGSAAFGFGLASDADVFTARLAALEPRWQVVNAAVVGYLSGQELAEFVHRGDTVAPAAVVALDGWNDLYVPLLAATRFPVAGLSFGHNWDVFHLVEERLRLYTLAGVPESRTGGNDVPFDELVKRITSAYAENLERLSRAAASRSARFLVVFQPWVESRATPPEAERQALEAFRKIGVRADPALYGNLVRAARIFLEKRGIPFLDLHESGPFRDARGALFQDSVHPNAEGHRLEASEIHRRLVELLPPTR